jgi:MFS family permease
LRKQFALKINQTFYYGWIILLVSAMSAFFASPGQTYAISAFIDSYILEFGYSRTVLSGLYSGATLISGLLMILVGKSVDRFGQRTAMITAGILLTLTTLFSSFTANIAMIFISFFLLRFLGQGSLILIPNSLVPQWFDQKRALAFSLMSLGIIAGNLVVPILNTFLIDALGWAWAWRIWSLGLLFIFLPFAAFLVIDKPEDIGLLPDNAKALAAHEVAVEYEKMKAASFTLSRAVKTKEFWFIGSISAMISLVTTGIMFHFYSLMGTKGIPPATTSVIFGMMALPGFTIPLVANTITRRFMPKQILFMILLLMAGDLVGLVFLRAAYGAAFFVLLYGFLLSLQNTVIGILWAKYFGRLYLGSIIGAATVFIIMGSALGPVPFGMSYDLTGSYTPALAGMVLVMMLGMVMALSLKDPHQKH